MRRNARIVKSPLTTHEINERTRERDTQHVEELLPCGCAWRSAKGGTSQWHFSSACGPWPPAYRSKAKYRRAT